MGAKKHVLIIDDDQALLNALSDGFKSVNATVSIISDPEKGLSEAIRLKPDLIILDILMPKLDGVELLEKLRAYSSSYCKTVPVLILTNLSDETVKQKVKKLGCRDYIVKSNTSLSNLADMVKSRL